MSFWEVDQKTCCSAERGYQPNYSVMYIGCKLVSQQKIVAELICWANFQQKALWNWARLKVCSRADLLSKFPTKALWNWAGLKLFRLYLSFDLLSIWSLFGGLFDQPLRRWEYIALVGLIRGRRGLDARALRAVLLRCELPWLLVTRSGVPLIWTLSVGQDETKSQHLFLL